MLDYDALNDLDSKGDMFNISVFVSVADDDSLLLVKGNKIVCDGDFDDCEQYIAELEDELKDKLQSLRLRADKLGFKIGDIGSDFNSYSYIVVDTKTKTFADYLTIDGVERFISTLENNTGSDSATNAATLAPMDDDKDDDAPF